VHRWLSADCQSHCATHAGDDGLPSGNRIDAKDAIDIGDLDRAGGLDRDAAEGAFTVVPDAGADADVEANQTAQASEVAGVGHDDVAGRVDRHGERLNEREAMSDLLIFAGRWVDECHTARTSGTLQRVRHHDVAVGREARPNGLRKSEDDATLVC
jgi:hypothetical protein